MSRDCSIHQVRLHVLILLACPPLAAWVIWLGPEQYVALTASSGPPYISDRIGLKGTSAVTPTITLTTTLTPTHACFPSWKVVDNPDPERGDSYPGGISAVSQTDIWMVGYNMDRDTYPPVARTLIEHWDGSRWDLIESPNFGEYTSKFADVEAVSANDVWAVGQYEFLNHGILEYHAMIQHWDGSTWSIFPGIDTGLEDSSLFGVSAASANDVWAVGAYCCRSSIIDDYPLTLHWDGVAWQSISVPEYTGGYLDPGLTDVKAISPNDVWAVGKRLLKEERSLALFLHWDGTQWNIVPNPDPGLAHNWIYSLDAVSPEDVWAVGSKSDNPEEFQTLILHWDGTSWAEVPSPSLGKVRTHLFGVATLSTNDVWAAGWYWDGPGTVSTPLLMHWDGARWSIVPTVLPPSLLRPIEAVSPADIWTAGYDIQGRILSAHYSTNFADVPPVHTFYSHVSCLACRGIISGYSDGTFRPNNLMTRGQLAKIVSNAAGFIESPDPQIFEDVAPDNTFYQWINRLTKRGHISGYVCGGPGEPCVNGDRPYFRPAANATRGQTSKIVSNAVGFGETPTEQTFEDVLLTYTFYREIQRLASRNIMGGYPCGSPGEPCLSGKPYFRPGNDVTRGQSSKIVANTFFPNCYTP